MQKEKIFYFRLIFRHPLYEPRKVMEAPVRIANPLVGIRNKALQFH
jgi:hypothetical protein